MPKLKVKIPFKDLLPEINWDNFSKNRKFLLKARQALSGVELQKNKDFEFKKNDIGAIVPGRNKVSVFLSTDIFTNEQLLLKVIGLADEKTRKNVDSKIYDLLQKKESVILEKNDTELKTEEKIAEPKLVEITETLHLKEEYFQVIASQEKNYIDSFITDLIKETSPDKSIKFKEDILNFLKKQPGFSQIPRKSFDVVGGIDDNGICVEFIAKVENENEFLKSLLAGLSIKDIANFEKELTLKLVQKTIEIKD